VPFEFAAFDAKAVGVSFDLDVHADELTVSLGGTHVPLLQGSEPTEAPLLAVISKAVQPS
jgi:hypothetical protein